MCTEKILADLIGAVRHAYIHIDFYFLRSCPGHINKTIFGYGYFFSNHYFAYGIWDVYDNPSSFFIDLQEGLTNDEMQCIIAGENPANVFSYEIYK